MFPQGKKKNSFSSKNSQHLVMFLRKLNIRKLETEKIDSVCSLRFFINEITFKHKLTKKLLKAVHSYPIKRFQKPAVELGA